MMTMTIIELLDELRSHAAARVFADAAKRLNCEPWQRMAPFQRVGQLDRSTITRLHIASAARLIDSSIERT